MNQEDEIENYKMFLYVQSIYKSLGKVCEINFKDKKSLGFFGGMESEEQKVLIYNFSEND